MSFYISNAVAIERIIFISLTILALGLVSIGGLWFARRQLSAKSADEALAGEISEFAAIAQELQPALKKAVRPLEPSLYERLTPEEKLLRAIFGRFETDKKEPSTKIEAETTSR